MQYPEFHFLESTGTGRFRVVEGAAEAEQNCRASANSHRLHHRDRDRGCTASAGIERLSVFLIGEAATYRSFAGGV
jgi:hypothetical protein